MRAKKAVSSAMLGALLGASCRAEPTPPPAPSAAPQAGAATANDKAVPEITVPRMRSESPTIDGSLDERAWFEAVRIGPFVNVGTGHYDAKGSVQGEARITWDDQALYVGFNVRDKSIRGGFPADAVDPHLWERDTVELMIDPDGDGDNKDYYEIQISPQNLVFDSHFDNYNAPKGGPAGPFGHQEWSSNLKSAVVLRGTIDEPGDVDEGYTVEARIPWESFGKAQAKPPKPGDRWRMNFYAMQDNGGVAWSPILGKGNFHRASRFGKVVWGP